MATADQVVQLRRLTQYDGTEPYDDSQLGAIIDTIGVHGAASRLWGERAAATAGLVDVSESGSSRSMGKLHANALTMATHYKKLADEESPSAPSDSDFRIARTRAIVREG